LQIAGSNRIGCFSPFAHDVIQVESINTICSVGGDVAASFDLVT